MAGDTGIILEDWQAQLVLNEWVNKLKLNLWDIKLELDEKENPLGDGEIVPAWEAGEYDPPMQEWLQLPVSVNCCPTCGSSHWGTRNPRGYFLVRECHDELSKGCNAKFRAPASLDMVNNIVEALMGFPRRFGMGDVK